MQLSPDETDTAVWLDADRNCQVLDQLFCQRQQQEPQQEQKETRRQNYQQQQQQYSVSESECQHPAQHFPVQPSDPFPFPGLPEELVPCVQLLPQPPPAPPQLLHPSGASDPSIDQLHCDGSSHNSSGVFCTPCGPGVAHGSVPIHEVVQLFCEDTGVGLGRGHAFALQSFCREVAVSRHTSRQQEPQSVSPPLPPVQEPGMF